MSPPSQLAGNGWPLSGKVANAAVTGILPEYLDPWHNPCSQSNVPDRGDRDLTP